LRQCRPSLERANPSRGVSFGPAWYQYQNPPSWKRAEPFAAQVQGGNIFLQAGFWNQAYRDELECFPSGAHDDQVDASTAAFNRLVSGLSYNIEAMQ